MILSSHFTLRQDIIFKPKFGNRVVLKSKKQQWAETNEREPKYPLLNGCSSFEISGRAKTILVQLADELGERRFKVRLQDSYLWTHFEIFFHRDPFMILDSADDGQTSTF